MKQQLTYFFMILLLLNPPVISAKTNNQAAYTTENLATSIDYLKTLHQRQLQIDVDDLPETLTKTVEIIDLENGDETWHYQHSTELERQQLILWIDQQGYITSIEYRVEYLDHRLPFPTFIKQKLPNFQKLLRNALEQPDSELRFTHVKALLGEAQTITHYLDQTIYTYSSGEEDAAITIRFISKKDVLTTEHDPTIEKITYSSYATLAPNSPYHAFTVDAIDLIRLNAADDLLITSVLDLIGDTHQIIYLLEEERIIYQWTSTADDSLALIEVKTDFEGLICAINYQEAE